MIRNNRTRDPELDRSDAIQDGMRDAHLDLARCGDAEDVSWYLRTVADNHLHGSPRDRWYLDGYNRIMSVFS